VAFENDVAIALLFPTLKQMNVFSIKALELVSIGQFSFKDWRGLLDDVNGLIQGFIPSLFERQEVGT
jgi:hypothetical protein